MIEWLGEGLGYGGGGGEDLGGDRGRVERGEGDHADGLPKKPAPAFYAAVLSAAGHAPGSVVHVGDSWEHDVVGARAAGLRTIWLNRTGAPLPAAGIADAEIRTLTDLPATLHAL